MAKPKSSDQHLKDSHARFEFYCDVKEAVRLLHDIGEATYLNAAGRKLVAEAEALLDLTRIRLEKLANK
jgi:hypothetical protein